MMDSVELIATAAFGLESVVAGELRALGYAELSVENGRVTFRAPLAAIPRCNLWLRTADRLLVKLGSFPAQTFDELFDGTSALPWADWLEVDSAFPVEGKSVRSTLHSVPAVQAVVKKAIVESLRRSTKRQTLPETGPECPVSVALLKDQVTVSLDTTGLGLHKRGYRREAGPAPLKETLAAGLLLLSRWRPELPLIDPCCGSGTLPIEAVLLGRNQAPGLWRRFTAEAWPRLPATLWESAREEARDLVNLEVALSVSGSDLDPEAIALAERHAALAKVSGDLSLTVRNLADLRLPAGPGKVVVNPPYGERMGNATSAETLYRRLGDLARESSGWAFFVLTAHPQFERFFGRRANRARKLYNGRLECQFLQFDSGSPGKRMV